MPEVPGNRMERPEIWGHLKDAPDIIEKVRIFREMIPDGIDSIVDVGCGDGAITNDLAQQWSVTGVDSSRAALQHVTSSALLADARHLPFSDQSFDLAMSSQLLEHLDDTAYAEVVAELQRIARTFLLISVPYQEDIDVRMIRCPACGWQEHVWGHLRQFTPESLIEDFPDFEALDVRIFGDLQDPAWPRPLLWAMHNVAKGWYAPEGQNPQCSRCGNTDFTAMKRFTPYLNLLKLAIDRIRFKRRTPYWLAVLARRRVVGAR